MSWPWSELGLSGPADPREIRRAYAQRLKEFRDPLVHMEKEGDTNQLRIDFSPKSWYNLLKSKLRKKG